MNGTDLKVLRIRQGVKASDLAKQLGVSLGRISQIEGEVYGPISDEWKSRFVKALSEMNSDVSSLKQKK